MSEQDIKHHDHNYNENQIQVLEGLEAVRKRPGMYIGSTSVRGLHHLIYEIVDNSIDEALAGYCDRITVTLNKDGSVSIRDNGRGVPTGINPKMGIPSVEMVFTVLHAGGKFGGGGYQISGGLHGVGASVVNALSEWLEIENCYEGFRYTERFERGKVVRGLEKREQTEQTGLLVTFMPDSLIFETLEFDYTMVLNRLREQAFLNAGLTIGLIDNRELKSVSDEEDEKESDGQEDEESNGGDDGKKKGYYQREKEQKSVTFCFEGGIRSFVEFLNSKKHATVVNGDVIYLCQKKGITSAEVASVVGATLEGMISSRNSSRLARAARASRTTVASCAAFISGGSSGW